MCGTRLAAMRWRRCRNELVLRQDHGQAMRGLVGVGVAVAARRANTSTAGGSLPHSTMPIRSSGPTHWCAGRGVWAVVEWLEGGFFVPVDVVDDRALALRRVNRHRRNAVA